MPSAGDSSGSSAIGVTSVSRNISSRASSVNPSGEAMCRRNVDTLRAYIWLACTGAADAKSRGAAIDTPWRTAVSPGSLSSQFPPRSAARSTMTDPGRMPATAAAVMSVGARRPSTSAVVMATSTFSQRLGQHLPLTRVERLRLLDGVAAGGRAAFLAIERDERGAPGSRLVRGPQDGRRRPERRRPRRLAVAMACKPATPAPRTSTRAAASVPAAVISRGNKRGEAPRGQQHRLVAGYGRH